MKCPKCQTENKENAKFCRRCGEKFSLICPQCGAENLPEDYFCDQCGQTLKEAPPIDFSEPQSYTPKHLADKILADRSAIEGEKKLVTVFFADVANYTAISEKLDPEEVHQIMDDIYEILIHKVHDYEGTVNEMTGDGIMALFGAPIALEDAPQRAIRSAYAIHREMTRFSDKIRQEKEGVPILNMRIGNRVHH